MNEEKTEIGKWGRKHQKFLQQAKRKMYSEMKKEGTLNQYLKQLDESAESMYQLIVQQMVERNPPPDPARDELAYIRHMNSIRNSAEEFVNEDRVYN